MQAHAFDQAIALAPQGADSWLGHSSQAYWNMVGPFGGVSAATLLNAVMQHPARLGEPVALTVNYASALEPGPFTVTARAARSNRSTQHWVIEMTQRGKSGSDETVLTASALSAVRRVTWGVNDTPMPAVPPPDQAPAGAGFRPVEWVKRYDLRTVSGAMPRQLDGVLRQGDAGTASLSQCWMRDEPPRPLDFCALAAYADIFYPDRKSVV